MNLSRRKFLHLTASAAALPAVTRIARAQNYPARSIRLVIPFPPGGAYDLVGKSGIRYPSIISNGRDQLAPAATFSPSGR